jgi:ankyrin repeat protein
MALRQNSILWICGKPGSGKSTLSKYICKRLTDEVLESPGTITVSFFFSRTSDIDKAPTRFLRSLLYQMFSQCSTDMGDLLSLASNQRSRSIASSRYRKLSSPWTSENLFGIFEESLVRISKYQKVFFIVDALDECSETERANVMSISSLIQSGRLETPVKLCLTGRNSPEWKLRLTDRPNIWKITLEDENSVDIKRFTELRITDLIRDSEDECRERIVKALSTKASGVFLWAFLAMKELEWVLQHRGNRTETLELSISTFPDELDGIYSAILDRITHANRHNHVLAALAWVCCARRPLSVVELQCALSVDGTCGFSAHEAEISLCASSIDEDWPFSHLGGLVEVGEPGQQVQFIHQTVHDFLLRVTPWSRLPWNKLSNEVSRLPYPQGVHNRLAEACLMYLKFSYDTEKKSVKRKCLRDESDGFLNYAVDYWSEHLKLSDVPSTAHFSILKYLDWPSTRVLGHWAHLHQKKIGDGTSSEYWGWTVLHAAAAFGLHSLALAILEVECSNLTRWDIGDANGRTPLSLAAEQGNLNLVKLLLNTGANISTRDNRYGLSPLHWAAFEGRKSTVEFLLERGADVNISDSSGTTSYCTALSVAAARGHKEIVKLLLENGANIDLFGLKNGWTALNLSAGYGHKAVVKLLIDWGADPNDVNPYTKQTPLYYATAGGHLDVIRFLLDHGGGMPQAKTKITASMPMSWTHRVAYSLVGLLDYTSNSSPRECPSSKTKFTYSSSSVLAKRQRNDNSAAGSSKRLCDVPESGEGSGDGGSGNDPNKPPISNLAPPSSLKGPSVRLACPYFKFDPERYGSPSSCAGPRGWPNMNRLKYESMHLQLLDTDLNLGNTFTIDTLCIFVKSATCCSRMKKILTNITKLSNHALQGGTEIMGLASVKPRDKG